jgi:hypothetical protein
MVKYMGGNIKMKLKKTGLEDEDWIYLAQDRILWRVFVKKLIGLRTP